jgi:hypothetical protein
MAKKIKEQYPPNRKETIRIRAGILKQKFSRDADFDLEQSKAERLHILRSTIEQAVLEFMRVMSPLEMTYQMGWITSLADQSVEGDVRLLLVWDEKRRTVDVPYKVFYTREQSVIELTGYRKNVSRLEFELDADPEEMKEETTLALTNLLIELIKA